MKIVNNQFSIIGKLNVDRFQCLAYVDINCINDVVECCRSWVRVLAGVNLSVDRGFES
jgi:hypothetical protein